MCFVWLSEHLQHAKNNSANMREVGDLRFTPRTPISMAVECNSPLFKLFPQNIYIAHETQKMQSLFTFFESSNA